MEKSFKLGDIARLTTPLARSPCWRKERWKNAEAAEAQLRSLLRRVFVKDITRLNTYHCPHCHYWHVGRKPVEWTNGVNPIAVPVRGCGCTFSNRCPEHEEAIQEANQRWIAKGRPGGDPTKWAHRRSHNAGEGRVADD